ncbi:MAG: protein translocase subunit SecF [bacterium]
MEFFKKTDVDFIKKMKWALLFSGLLTLAGIVSLIAKGGPNLGIDFAGGSLIQLRFNNTVTIGQIREALTTGGFGNAEIQNIPEDNVIIIRIKKSATPAENILKDVKQLIQTKLPDNGFIVEQNDMVAPVMGREIYKKGIWAVIGAFAGIMIYVAIRFKGETWGTAGIIALIHDVFVVVTVFSIINKEITMPVLAALLTIAGFSINDTIVIYDRIRENLKLKRGSTLYQIFNDSINETLSRTIITALTVLLVLLAIFFKGGEVLHDFSLALLIGVITGMYSTIFIASPLVYSTMVKKRGTR